MTETFCPCGSQQSYEHCCKKFIIGEQIPSTPELLMRSRYSAYAVGDLSYIVATMQGQPAKDFDIEDTSQWLQDVQWEGLTVINHKIKGPKLGFVSFEARYSFKGTKQSICEKSEFHKIGDKWFYVGGKALNPSAKW
ncbi:MAG: hypothetical protein BGO43_11330 [Gammaproteobacteria bacterium 39-13]|nr:hypothetical protein [Gammaproteobacteria bacterium]OJV85226.1 MAG: hypothetical protein BGO43_11330 [Gammaproteobacteria bacterium 39-13]